MPHPRSRIRPAGLVAAGVLLCAGVAVACSDGGSGGSSVGRSRHSRAAVAGQTTVRPAAKRSRADLPTLDRTGSLYAVPDPLPSAAAGVPIAASSPRTDDGFGGASRTELLYHSTTHDGRDVAVSGTLLVPPGDPPREGWPIVSWGHGTTGVADVCAPSTTPNLFYNEYAQEVRSFLDAGYAVAATDYVGLGTPGLHTYLVGDDLGHATTDVVTAARRMDPSLGTTWFAVGHSEGGEAALWATRAPQTDPDAHLAGAVAIAPSSGLQAALPAVMTGGAPADMVYATYILAGLSQVDPTVDVGSHLGPVGAAQRDLLLENGCLLDAGKEFAGQPPGAILSLTTEESVSLSEKIAALGNPENAAVNGPVLVLQGETDRDVPAGLTATMVDKLNALGSRVEYRAYPGLDHDQVLGPSMCDLLAWLRTHGGRPVGTCVAQATDLS